jgi:hypothetical protein
MVNGRNQSRETFLSDRRSCWLLTTVSASEIFSALSMGIVAVVVCRHVLLFVVPDG